ncbi:MAG TPA: Rieske 2Fe-2S domain-containing protein [Longimicrobiales bacterium]|nr:Rieske 2Fe-2S domain-containing protein [Longimicrobiales bacterium]
MGPQVDQARPAGSDAVDRVRELDALPRRSFLKMASASAATVVGAVVGAPAVTAFLSPLLRQAAPEAWVQVGEAALFDTEVPLKIDFVQTVADAWLTTRAMRTVWLYTEDAEHFTAFNGRCTHLGCGFGYDAAAKLYRCPCHNGLFRVTDGAVVDGPPPRGLDPLPVKVENGVVSVAYRDFRLGIPDRIPV